MTDKLKVLSDEFKMKHELAVAGFDSHEELTDWDMEEYGEMDAYYDNLLITVIVRMCASDGNFSRGETDYLKDVFNFVFTLEELREIYESMESLEDDDAFVQSLKKDVDMLWSTDGKLCSAFCELVKLACEIIKETDGIAPEEVALADRLLEAL